MDGNNQNPAQPAAPAPGVPQNQDKTDAMTYPIGSQNAAPVDPNQQVQEEDHRSILERIMGIFSKGKKEESNQVPPTSADEAPTNATPPPGQ